jgi:hypothetical protein
MLRRNLLAGLQTLPGTRATHIRADTARLGLLFSDH